MVGPQPVREFDHPDLSVFRDEIYPSARPAILRGLGADLEPVKLALRSEHDLARHLATTIGDRPVKFLAGKPDAGSTFFFEDNVSQLNFDRREMPFARFVDAALGSDDEAMLFMESTNLPELSAELAKELALPIAPGGVDPLVWIGNRTGVQTHFDQSQNIACVICGRRRFTLFPPDQTPNLYMAPFERSPSGAPVSMVRLEDPDHARFPRFREALDHALVADLGPGDALFIPYMWWHQVQALGSFNVLVNYWWNEYEVLGSPVDAMLHAILAIRDLPAPMRDAWKGMFETFVFKDHGEPMDHVEPSLRGGMGALNGMQRAELWQFLAGSLVDYVQRMRSGGGTQ